MLSLGVMPAAFVFRIRWLCGRLRSVQCGSNGGWGGIWQQENNHKVQRDTRNRHSSLEVVLQLFRIPRSTEGTAEPGLRAGQGKMSQVNSQAPGSRPRD